MSLRVMLLGDSTHPHLSHLAGELAKRRWDVHVVSLQMGGMPGVEVHTLLPRLPGKLSEAMLIRQVRGLLDHLMPDVVHAFGTNPYGELAKQAECAPFVLSIEPREIDCLYQWAPFQKGKLLKVWREADRRLVTSHALAHMIASQVPDLAVQVIPHGVDLERFDPGEDPEVPTIGCGLPLEADGGQEYLICALRLVVERRPERPLRLLLAGEGEELPNLDRLARELAMANRTVFKGFIPPEERPKFLRELTIYAMPVVREQPGFAQAAMEAASCGLPVVASWVGGLGEVVLDEVTGLLVPPKNPELLADALERMLDDSSMRAEMGANGRALIRRTYDWRQNVTQLETLYQDVIDGQPRGHDYLVD